MNNRQWFIIKSDDYLEKALTRFEQLKDVKVGDEHDEMLLLAHLIARYQNDSWSLPDVDPIEMIKIRMKDFGYKASDLAASYGDKGTVSKVLNYKQPLSLAMIRKFSDLLH